MTLQEMRADFITRRKGSVSLPIAGAMLYAIAAALSLWFPKEIHNLILTLCFWAILPVGIVIMKLRGEQEPNPANPFFKLSAVGRILALSTWSIHIMMWIYAPDLMPLTVGICFALHWANLSWMMDHPVGFIHLGMRITFVIVAWLLAPYDKMGAVAAGVTLAYIISAIQMSRIDWPAYLAERHQ
ncbi:MAG: DUF7010 family protein [Sphingomicrobium sp.]